MMPAGGGRAGGLSMGPLEHQGIENSSLEFVWSGVTFVMAWVAWMACVEHS